MGVLCLFSGNALKVCEPEKPEEHKKPAGHSELMARIIAHIVLPIGQIASLTQCVFCIVQSDLIVIVSTHSTDCKPVMEKRTPFLAFPAPFAEIAMRRKTCVYLRVDTQCSGGLNRPEPENTSPILVLAKCFPVLACFGPFSPTPEHCVQQAAWQNCRTTWQKQLKRFKPFKKLNV